MFQAAVQAGPTANHRPTPGPAHAAAEGGAGVGRGGEGGEREWHRWNGEDWGLGGVPLEEVVMTPRCGPVGTGARPEEAEDPFIIAEARPTMGA